MTNPSSVPTALPTDLGPGPFAVTTHGLGKRFGREVALRGVDLQVPQGAVYVLVGPNGAGKSTLLKVLLNLLHADAGHARVNGIDPAADAARVRAQIGYVSERPDPGYGWMRVGRLLQHHAVYYPAWDAAYAGQLCRALDVKLDRRAGALSKGQSRAVQLVLAMAHRPSLLVLDEPTDGFDPVVRDKVLSLLAAHIAETSCTTLISTHLVYEVDRLVDHVGVLQQGRLVAQVTRDDMHRNLRLYRAEVPGNWTAPSSVPGIVVARTESARDIQWTVWGSEQDVAAALTRAGASVRDVSPLRLDDAAIALLRNKDLP